MDTLKRNFAVARTAVAALWLVCISLQVNAAELQLKGSESWRVLAIEGPIETGDYERFLTVVKENQGLLSGVYLFSAGGDFVEAMKIGRALRALELSSQVPMRDRRGRPMCADASWGMPTPRNPENCTAASAAFFIHIGAVHRGGNFLAVHRPYFEPGRFGNLTEGQAQAAYANLQKEARTYMTEMGVPPSVQDEIFATPSDRVALLDERTVKAYFWGDLPYRYEWRRAKCSRLTGPEGQRLEALGAKVLARDTMTAAEQADFSSLQAKKDQESKCDVGLGETSRVAAYQKMFGSAPDDTANHNFAKWAEAPKYLGRTFEDVTAEERFEPEGTGSFLSLRRAATATSPSAMLMDEPDRRRYVSSVAVLKVNPSGSFVERVRSSLEAAWGKPTAAASSDRMWTWKTGDFNATLKLEPQSSQGPFLALTVAKSPRK
jgi:hypothetical protein